LGSCTCFLVYGWDNEPSARKVSSITIIDYLAAKTAPCECFSGENSHRNRVVSPSTDVKSPSCSGEEIRQSPSVGYDYQKGYVFQNRSFYCLGHWIRKPLPGPRWIRTEMHQDPTRCSTNVLVVMHIWHISNRLLQRPGETRHHIARVSPLTVRYAAPFYRRLQPQTLMS